ncbi:MAG: hypothetical protein QG615_1738 [Nitrospirota bacterium]|nr:hypothetical protein [Nitrospirota bacterium]
MSFRSTFYTDRCVLTHTLLSLLLLSLLPPSLHAAPRSANSGKMEVLPSQKAAPAAVFLDAQGTEADLRRQLRLKTGVTELSTDLAQTRFSVAPVGTFGFAPQQGLGLALVSQSPDMLLERTAPAPNAYEIHKLADGSALVVGL